MRNIYYVTPLHNLTKENYNTAFSNLFGDDLELMTGTVIIRMVSLSEGTKYHVKMIGRFKTSAH